MGREQDHEKCSVMLSSHLYWSSRKQTFNESLKAGKMIFLQYKSDYSVMQIFVCQMGKDNAEAYGKRNSTEGEFLVRINPTRIIAEKDIAGWN